MTVNIIDPHLHLFDRTRGDYHWLKTQNPPFWPDKSLLQRDFSIDDLSNSLALTANISLSGFVHIEAGFDNEEPWRELDFIDSLKPLARRTVASIDLLATPESFTNTLDELQQYQSLIGARHILDEQAFSILLSPNAQQNFASLNEIADFVFELQLPLASEVIASESSNRVMPLLIETISKNNQLRFIINHAGFPPTKSTTDTCSDEWRLWQSNISELAQYSNVFIKCSGWEMAARQYEMSWFSTVTSFCIEKFSIERVMIASNFPLCLLGKSVGKVITKEPCNNQDNELDNKLGNKTYSSYWQDILGSSLMKQCSEKEKSALLYSNALNIYKL